MDDHSPRCWFASVLGTRVIIQASILGKSNSFTNLNSSAIIKGNDFPLKNHHFQGSVATWGRYFIYSDPFLIKNPFPSINGYMIWYVTINGYIYPDPLLGIPHSRTAQCGKPTNHARPSCASSVKSWLKSGWRKTGRVEFRSWNTIIFMEYHNFNHEYIHKYIIYHSIIIISIFISVIYSLYNDIEYI